MKKRMLSLVAVVALLVSVLAVGFVPAAAVTDGWYGNATVPTVTAGQFKHFARYTADTESVVSGKSLIQGMIPTGSPYSGPKWSHYGDEVGNIENLTDGVIGTAEQMSEYTTLRDSDVADHRYLYFDLGTDYKITDFIVASSQFHGGTYGVKNLKIYVANTDTLCATRTGAFTEGAADNDYRLVYSNQGFNVSAGGPTVGATSQNNSTWKNALNFHIQPEDGVAEIGRYVCFVVKANAVSGTYTNRFSELAVYGERPWSAGTMGKYQSYARFTQVDSIVGDAQNLISGMPAYGSNYTSDGDQLSDWYHETGTYAGGYNGYEGGATDGKIAAAVADAATTEQVFRSSNTTTLRYFYYDLGATYDISNFLVASTQSGDTGGVLKNFSIYVAEEWKEAASFTAHKGAFTDGFTQVFGYNDATSTVYTHYVKTADGAPVRGRYVCFVFTAPQKSGNGAYPIVISELGVYGEEYIAPLVWNNGATCGQYLTFDRFTQLSDIVEGTSLIQGKTAYGSDFSADGTEMFSDSSITNWYNEGTLKSTSTYYNGGFIGYEGGATDGMIAASVDECAATEQVFRGGNNNTTLRYFYYDLGASYDISDFVVASTQSTDSRAVLKTLSVYVAETWTAERNMIVTKGAALDGFTKVFDYSDADSTAYIHRIQPTGGAPVTGRYVCFVFTAPQKSGTTWPIPISELAVYGTLADGVDTLGAQLGDDYDAEAATAKLRMGFDVETVAGSVTYQEDSFVGDYTNAKVMVNGKAYDLAQDAAGNYMIGALVGIASQVQSEELVLDMSSSVLNVKNTDVKIVCANNIYDIADDGTVTYTAQVVGIPQEHFDKEIIGRAFMGYKDENGTVRYVYGELLTRSVNYYAVNDGSSIPAQ